MNKQQVKIVLESAKNSFLMNDNHLISVEANERSMTHKFAECLQAAIGCSWNVDCEYNRYGDEPKRIEEIMRIIVDQAVSTDETKATTVYPDIIIHKRGDRGPNLLVIEAKKDANKEERRRDIRKLTTIKKSYKYIFSVFINFKTRTKSIEIEFTK